MVHAHYNLYVIPIDKHVGYFSFFSITKNAAMK